MTLGFSINLLHFIPMWNNAASPHWIYTFLWYSFQSVKGKYWLTLMHTHTHTHMYTNINTTKAVWFFLKNGRLSHLLRPHLPGFSPPDDCQQVFILREGFFLVGGGMFRLATLDTQGIRPLLAAGSDTFDRGCGSREGASVCGNHCADIPLDKLYRFSKSSGLLDILIRWKISFKIVWDFTKRLLCVPNVLNDMSVILGVAAILFALSYCGTWCLKRQSVMCSF